MDYLNIKSHDIYEEIYNMIDFEKEHDEQKQSDQINNDSSDKQDNNKICFCPRCGSKIENEMMFCGKCGLDITKAATNYKAAAGINNNPYSGQFTYTQQPAAYGDRSYMFGGDAVSPDAEIDGVRADEMAAYVGANGGKYIKKFFKTEKSNKKIGFKWQALLFPQCWTAYRKMLVPFIISLLVLIIAAAPLMISLGNFTEIMYSDMLTQIGDAQAVLNYTDVLTYLSNGTFIPSDELLLQSVYFVLSMLLLVVVQLINGLVFALIGDHLYKKQVIRKIKKIRQRFNQPSLDNNEYRIKLARSGGVNPFNAFSVVALIYILYNVAYYLMLNLSL